jgi:hypothetical protein
VRAGAAVHLFPEITVHAKHLEPRGETMCFKPAIYGTPSACSSIPVDFSSMLGSIIINVIYAQKFIFTLFATSANSTAISIEGFLLESLIP